VVHTKRVLSATAMRLLTWWCNSQDLANIINALGRMADRHHPGKDFLIIFLRSAHVTEGTGGRGEGMILFREVLVLLRRHTPPHPRSGLVLV
jgi:hypothetical protein